MGFPYRMIYVSLHSGNLPFLIGPTGCGKTEGTRAISRDWLGVEPSLHLELRLAQQDPITLGSGVPMRSTDKTFDATIERRLYEVGINGGGFIFWDELPDADIDQQRAVNSVLLDRDIAGNRVEALMIAAGNRPKDGANELDKRLISRMQWFEVHRDRQQFIRALREGWDKEMGKPPKVPHDWATLVPEFERKVALFIETHDEALPSEDLQLNPEFPAHPNERTWQKFGVRWLACATASKLSKKEIQTGLEGCVGKGLGAQFMMWDRHGGLDIKGIIKDTTELKKYVKAAPDMIDTIFDAVGAYVAESVITGDECGGFYAAALKYGFSPDLILRHLKKISEKLPKAVRESIANEIAVRQGA